MIMIIIRKDQNNSDHDYQDPNNTGNIDSATKKKKAKLTTKETAIYFCDAYQVKFISEMKKRISHLRR